MKKTLIVLAVIALVAVVVTVIYQVVTRNLRKTVFGKLQASAKKHGKTLDEVDATEKLKTLNYFQLRTLSQWMDLMLLDKKVADDDARLKALKEKMKSQIALWPAAKYEMIVYGS
ncbi:MAG TPA: hypothetical protein VEB40_00985 [Flavipsychrobacter sp.]|nr:hypothetical protein [Flavipsychrobacter sp.]